jgi:potassium/chloride transporter 9
MDAYVDIIRDVLKMRKNLCVCRRFGSLNKDALRAQTNPIFIDVWPVSTLNQSLTQSQKHL